MKRLLLTLCLVPATPALAQTPDLPRILISATGTVKTQPDRATIGFTVRGEGTSSDEAMSKVRDTNAAIRSGIASLAGEDAELRSSELSIDEVRPKECDANDYGRKRLSTGPCAVIGYVATMPVTLNTSRVPNAGTLVGLISRLGGVDAQINSFSLKNDAEPRSAAMQVALRNAHEQAQLIAQGSGSRLGPLVRVQDSDYREETMDMPKMAHGDISPPPPAVIVTAARSPVQLTLTPAPIETTVRIMVAYQLNP